MGTIRVSDNTYRKLVQLREDLPGNPPLSSLADEAIERYNPLSDTRPDHVEN